MLYLKIYKNLLLNKYTLHSLYAMQYLTFYSFPLLEGTELEGWSSCHTLITSFWLMPKR